MPPAAELFAQNQRLEKELVVAMGEVAALKAQVAWLRQQMFGGGKSETLDRAQVLLKLEGLSIAAAAAKTETVTYQRRQPTGEKRPVPAETFAHLPVKEQIVIEPAEVKAEPEAFEQIGEERTFEVDVVPPQFFRREFIRPKFQRKADKSQAPVVALAPARPVAGGYASAGLLAWVILAKYVDHQPLFRQEKMAERWGVRLPRQSMVDWVRIGSEWLEPIYQLMLAGLLKGNYLQADETPIRCNDPDEPRGGTTQGYLWVVSRPGGDVVFDWRVSRRHGELPSLLGHDFKGLLQSDAYGAYAAYAEAHEGVEWIMCWAHARRRFFENLKESPKAARVVLKLIGRMYQREREWDAAGISAQERAAARATGFARTLKWLHAVTLNLRKKVMPQSGLGKACDYLLANWKPLIAHAKYGHTKLDTNLVENAIRPSCIGKKNWLFIGHPDAGQRSAIIYSMVVSCQRHGKDPFAYLKDVLTRLPLMTNQDDLSPLLPVNWQPAQSK
jgi:transposase